MRHNSSGPN